MEENKKKTPTWQEKLDNAEPLNHLEEVKADADFNYHQRRREENMRSEFEQRKNAGRLDVRPGEYKGQGDFGDTEESDQVDNNAGDNDPSMKELRARAEELGVAKNGSKEELKARIAEAEDKENE